MKKILIFIYTFIFAISGGIASLSSEIIETNEIKALIPFVNQDSFVFLNVSSTLYSHSNTLGSRQWGEYFLDRILEVVDDEESAQQWHDKIKSQLVTHIPKITNVQKALESTGITFIGIRYGQADAIKENFDPTLGTIEFLAFMNEGKILSDEEALKTMPDDKSVDYEILLDQYIQQAMLGAGRE